MFTVVTRTTAGHSLRSRVASENDLMNIARLAKDNPLVTDIVATRAMEHGGNATIEWHWER